MWLSMDGVYLYLHPDLPILPNRPISFQRGRAVYFLAGRVTQFGYVLLND